MLERLFSSKTRVEILGRVLLHPEREFHARELERQIGPGSYRSVWLELKNLEELGILLSRHVARTVRYRLNAESPLVPELTELFRKQWAVRDLLGQALAKVGGVVVAFVYGSFATGEFGARSDVDLIIIGGPDADALDTVLADVESAVGREISYHIFSPGEWAKELEAGSAFIGEVLSGPKLFVVGSADGLEEMAR